MHLAQSEGRGLWYSLIMVFWFMGMRISRQSVGQIMQDYFELATSFLMLIRKQRPIPPPSWLTIRQYLPYAFVTGYTDTQPWNVPKIIQNPSWCWCNCSYQDGHQMGVNLPFSNKGHTHFSVDSILKYHFGWLNWLNHVKPSFLEVTSWFTLL